MKIPAYQPPDIRSDRFWYWSERRSFSSFRTGFILHTVRLLLPWNESLENHPCALEFPTVFWDELEFFPTKMGRLFSWIAFRNKRSFNLGMRINTGIAYFSNCSETVLFLHQIFLKGLMARMENWPTLVLGKFKVLCFLPD